MLVDRIKGSAPRTFTVLRALIKLIFPLLALAVGLFVSLTAWQSYADTSMTVFLSVDGTAQAVRTHVGTVGALLEQQSLQLTSADMVWPSPDSILTPGTQVRVERARPVTIYADGREMTIPTRATTAEDILREADIHMGPRDVVVVNDQPATPQTPGTLSGQRVLASRGAGATLERETIRTLRVYRAVELTISDGGVQSVLVSTAPTVGEALQGAGLDIYTGDSVLPDPATPLVPGMFVYIERAVPIEIEVDARVIPTRTRAPSVGEALAQEGIALVGMDYCDPSPDTPISADLKIRVVRQRQAFLVEQEPISYQTVWRSDAELEIDQRRVQVTGQQGMEKRRIRVLLRDGQEVERKVLDDWVALEPQDQVIAYGTKIVVRELETPSGTIQYWRKVRMLATSYTAATSGKTRDSPTYGITRLGWVARRGIVAVDPTVIKLGTRVYVPGYGLADVGDTGGGILGRRIDLCYDEGSLVLWYRWLDVYQLAPAPPADQIRYVLPDWPLER